MAGARPPSQQITLLDGPMGTALEARGVALPAPAWSALAVAERPDDVRAVHQAWAQAGAQVHTVASFRTTRRALSTTPWARRWEDLLQRAVRLCREGAGPGATVAGSLAPLEDCWRPDLTPSPAECTSEHAELAQALAAAGVDLMLVETMPSVRELGAAVAAAAATGLPVWAAVSLGPEGDFLTTQQVRDAAAVAADAGASAFGINCTAVPLIEPLLDAIAHAPHRPPQLLAYGNALFPGSDQVTPEQYADAGQRWYDAGACILGTCCGTTEEHLRALGQRLRV